MKNDSQTYITAYFLQHSGLTYRGLVAELPGISVAQWKDLLDLKNDCCVGNECMKLINTCIDLENMTTDVDINIDWMQIYTQILIYLFA